MADLINQNDSLNDGREKLNKSIKDSETAFNTSTEAIDTANQAKQKSDSTREQLDQIVIDGDSSVEAAQARVDANGQSYTTLKARLDEEHQKTTSQLAQTENIGIVPSFFGAIGDGEMNDTQAIKDTFNFAKENKRKVLLEGKSYYMTEPFMVPNDVDVEGMSNSVLVFEVGGRHAIKATDTKNAHWKNVTIERIGIPPTTSLGNHSVFDINGFTEDSFVLEDVEVTNNVQPANSTHNISTRAIHLYDNAKPVLKRVVGRGGGANRIETGSQTAGISIGATLNSNASPTLYNCIGYSGNGITSGIELDNTGDGVHAKLYNCEGYGKEGHQTVGISIDDMDNSYLYNCRGVAYGPGSMGLGIYANASPTIVGCHFELVGHSPNGYAIHIENGTPTLKNVTYRSRNGGFTSNHNARPIVDNLKNIPSTEKTYFVNQTANNQEISLGMDDEFTINTLELLIFLPAASGTLDIGTTLNGKEIASGIDLTSRGWQGLAIPKNELKKIRQTTDKLYLTLNGAIGIVPNAIHVSVVTEYAKSGGVLIDSKGIEMSNTTIVVPQKSTALTVWNNTIDNDNSLFSNCHFETKEDVLGNTITPISLQKGWLNAPFYNCSAKGNLNRPIFKGSKVDYNFYKKNLVADTNNVLTTNGNSSVLCTTDGYLAGYRMIMSQNISAGSIEIIIRDKQSASVLSTKTITSGNFSIENFGYGDISKVFNNIADIEVVFKTSSDFVISSDVTINFNLSLAYN